MKPSEKIENAKYDLLRMIKKISEHMDTMDLDFNGWMTGHAKRTAQETLRVIEQYESVCQANMFKVFK